MGKSDAREEVEHYPAPAPVEQWVDRFGDAPRKGSDILVQALERQGVDIVFAYPGGASLEIHQALTRSDTVQNVLCRHEQGEIFAAEGYSKTTGRVSVCIATSGPGATNLVTGLADALLDSVPMVAITGQVPRALIGTDSFQETPIVEVSRQITKHTYLVMDVNDIPRVVKEAFFLARSGRPGAGEAGTRCGGASPRGGRAAGAARVELWRLAFARWKAQTAPRPRRQPLTGGPASRGGRGAPLDAP